MFCDWLNVWQQFDGDFQDFLGGRVVSIEGACGLSRMMVPDAETGEIGQAWAIAGNDAEIEFDTAKFAAHRGSYETNLLIRFVNGKLEVRGNPSAYGRLDNLFGVTMDEGIEIYNAVLRSIGLPVQFSEGVQRDLWLQQEQTWSKEYTGAHITRIDWTENRAVGMGRVRDYHRWLAQQKLYRSSPNDEALEKFARWNYDTVYTSESKFWINAKHYDKSKALEEKALPEYLKRLKKAARDGKIPKSQVRPLFQEAEDYLLKLAEWCAEKGITRGEWSLRNRWFAQNKGVGFWVPGETEEKLREVVAREMEKVDMRACVYQEDAFDDLTDKEYRVVERWKRGEEIKDGLLSKSAFYRFRTSILEKTGYDIAARPMVSGVSEFRPVYFQVRPLSLADAPVWYQRPSFQLPLAA